MVPAEYRALGGSTFTKRCATELTTTNDQRIVKQTTLFQIFNQRRDRTIHGGTLLRQPLFDPFGWTCAMEIPTPVKQLYESYTLFNQTTGQQTIVCKVRFARLGTIISQRLLGFACDVHHFRNRSLHAERQFILSDPRQSFWMSKRFNLHRVQITKGVERLTTQGTIHPGRIGRIQNGIALRTTLHALENGRQKSAAERVLAAVGLDAAGNQHHETWQVIVFGSQAIRHPRPHRWTSRLGRAGQQQQLRRRMIELIGRHRLDHANLVGDFLYVGNRIG